MDEKTKIDSIIQTVKEVLDDIEVKYSFDDKDNLFKFKAKLNPVLSITSRILVDETCYVNTVSFGYEADENDERMMRDIAEFIHRANFGLPTVGNFEFDMNDGEIRYKYCVDHLRVPFDKAVVENSIIEAFSVIDTYSFGFIYVILGKCSPKEAIKICETKKKDDTEDTGDADDTDDTDELRTDLFGSGGDD